MKEKAQTTAPAPDLGEAGKFKQPTTLDEALDARLNPIIDAINEHVEKIYKDFNVALFKQMERIDNLAGVIEGAENGVTKMVQVLWGIVNKANVRNAALERVLFKNGLKQEDFENELIAVEEELMKTGEWAEASLEKISENLIKTEIPEPRIKKDLQE